MTKATERHAPAASIGRHAAIVFQTPLQEICSVSSRDRLNYPEDRTPRSRSSQPSKRERTDDLDQDFWEIDQEEDDRSGDEQPIQRSQPRTPRRTRTSPPSRGGTAQQIDRLRNNLARGGDGGHSSRQSLGRNYLARSPREPAPDDQDDIWDDEDQTWAQADAPPRNRHAGRTGPAGQRPHVTETWVGRDEDEDDRYYDDEVDFDEYDAPARRTPLTQAPSIRLSRAKVTRPSMPSAISQADLVNDAPALAMIGIGLVSLAGMAILVANRAETLGPSFATHVSASGVLKDIRGSEALWRLPLLATMLTLMNIGAAWFISPIDRFASRFLIAAAIIVQIVAWIALIRIL